MSSPVSRACSWSSACSRVFVQVSGLIPAGTGSAGARPSCGERRDPGGSELLDLRPVDAGDAREVVDASQYASQSALKSQMPQWSTG